MESYSIDREIDLIPIAISVVQRWYWILLAAVVGGIVAAVVTTSTARYYEANATVLFVGDRTRLTLDSRLITLEDNLSNYTTRRQALISLATSNVIEAQFPPKVIEQLVTSSSYQVGLLASNIKVQDEGDLLHITARSSSPQKAQLLANEWASSFVTHVNTTLYGIDPSVIMVSKEQIAEARESYERAQKAFVEHIGNNRLDEIENQIDSLSRLLDTNREVDIAFYQYQLARAEKVSLLLEDAKGLQKQISEGEVLPGEKLSALFLRIRAADNDFNAWQATSSQPLYQIHLEQPATITESDVNVQADLDQLIASLEEQLASLKADLEQSANSLASNEPAAPSGWTVKEQEALYDRLQTWRAQQEELQGKAEALSQARDVAFEKLLVVERQLAEQQVLANQSSSEVRIASEALLPRSPASQNAEIKIAVGIAVGAIFGFFLAVMASLRITSIFRSATPSSEGHA